MNKGLNVLSLCDGISCAHVALDRAGISVNNYFASEIKDIAIKVTQENYPNTIQIGDVNKIFYKNGVLYTEKGEFKINFDLVCFGSPCQSFSIAMKKEDRIGLEDREKSGLYIECKRILDEIKPKYFFVENVGSMKKDDIEYLSRTLGIKPIRVNSKIVAPALRDRYYWSNIPYTPPIEIENNFCDILESGYTPRKKARALLKSGGGICNYQDYIKLYRRVEDKRFGNIIFKDKDTYNQIKEIYSRYFKDKKGKELDAAIEEHPDYRELFKNGIRHLSQLEMERCQTLPEGYTNCLDWIDAQDVIGDGWTIDIITCWFKNLSE